MLSKYQHHFNFNKMNYHRFRVCVIVSLFILISCDNNNVITHSLNAPEAETVIVQQPLDDHDFAISLYSMIQVNNSGLYVTPAQVINDSVLYYYPNERKTLCCHKVEGIIRQGRGPLEMTDVRLSTKTVTGDTLIFFSSHLSKLITIDNNGLVNEIKLQEPDLTKMGYAFSYNKTHLAFSLEPALGNEHLIEIINTVSGDFVTTFPRRVPFGFEPAIRNQVFSMAAVPDGFVVSFVGDRKLYRFNFNGDILDEIIMGKSEPIGKPYKIQNPQSAPSSKPYIPKIEYHNGYLFVLMDQQIWILKYEDFEPVKRLKILRDPNEEIAPVTDFSVTSDFIYVRMGRNELYRMTTNSNWYNPHSL